MFFTIKKMIIIILSICIMHPFLADAAPKKIKAHRHVTAKKPAKSVKKSVSRKKTQKIVARKTKPVQKRKSTHVTHHSIKPKKILASKTPPYLFTSMEKDMVSFVRKTVENIRYTNYKLGGAKIDSLRGIYIVDCSRYVDHILKKIYPRAYNSLTNWSGTEKPTTYDYYQYFTNLSEDSRHWNAITDVDDLRAGDILVFRNKNRYGMETGGHIMIVMDQPERHGDTFLIRIADSAPARHSKDTRKLHASGIGIGNMLLKVNPHTSLPYAYAWQVGSRWETNVNFAMARPVGFG